MLNPTPVIKSQVMQRINHAPAAKVWTPVDFLDLGSRDAVDKTLQRMVASNDLRRIDRGLYDQPRMNSLTGQLTAPDYLSVSDAVARRDQVRVLILPEPNRLGMAIQLTLLPGCVSIFRLSSSSRNSISSSVDV